MKVKENCIIGDPVALDRYTSDWESICLHPATFYRRIEQFQKGLRQAKGLYTEIDNGDYVYIRFSDKDDLTEFYRLHHNYL